MKLGGNMLNSIVSIKLPFWQPNYIYQSQFTYNVVWFNFMLISIFNLFLIQYIKFQHFYILMYQDNKLLLLLYKFICNQCHHLVVRISITIVIFHLAIRWSYNNQCWLGSPGSQSLLYLLPWIKQHLKLTTVYNLNPLPIEIMDISKEMVIFLKYYWKSTVQ